MDRIASFAVDHNKLLPGLYLSRQDGDVVTLDLRFKKPNTGDLLSNSEMHSVEHLIATLLRNSEQKDAVIYFGPMGCQTGFYFLFDSRLLDLAGAVALVQEVFAIQFTRSVGQGKQSFSHTFLSERFEVIYIIPIVIKMKTVDLVCKVSSNPQAVISLIKNDIFQIIRTKMISGMRIKMFECSLFRLI